MLEELLGKVGPAKLRLMLGKTLVACEKDYADVLALLEQQNWEQAAKQVHSFKTTANLLNCQDLVRSLEMIEQEDPGLMSQPGFLQRLEREYLGCVDAIQQLLRSLS